MRQRLWFQSTDHMWEFRRTHIQVLQTVPAERVLAALAQHLCTALVPLDVDATHGALLDGSVGVPVGVTHGRGGLDVCAV